MASSALLSSHSVQVVNEVVNSMDDCEHAADAHTRGVPCSRPLLHGLRVRSVFADVWECALVMEGLLRQDPKLSGQDETIREVCSLPCAKDLELASPSSPSLAPCTRLRPDALASSVSYP